MQEEITNIDLKKYRERIGWTRDQVISEFNRRYGHDLKYLTYEIFEDTGEVKTYFVDEFIELLRIPEVDVINGNFRKNKDLSVDDMINNGFGITLKTIRKRHHMTLKQLAKMTGISYSSIYCYENEKKIPSKEYFWKLYEALVALESGYGNNRKGA
ncbi:helix-turn-helix domain-containing protein [Convivina praedatoris]|uniref:HTH cro/C1-type domain-containing protein n=1 Tax=Convivina praedatoris TaxID=2880963 RepID=A0ABM9D3J0_9LACO|nr:helix-turn-helix transcriptional regulator [Convivina sp. LMG 32447]CAH1857544.1 hypothetical protein LMG032447_01587 [Convivina sp. LMG 32447]